ncbi:MAG: hypothetical protein LC792_04025 [Actinobacteria bacterium]|nr:hypothetical protein [Actinomycetota bacterium]
MRTNMNLAFLASFILFLIAALAGLFGWNLGQLDATAWGLAALALGFLWPVGVRHTP